VIGGMEPQPIRGDGHTEANCWRIVRGGKLAARKNPCTAMNEQLTVPRDAIAMFCKANALRELALFGSAIRADFHAESDVDVLIDIHPDARVGLVALQRMRDELSALFGRPVDLVTRAGLNRHIRDEVERQAEVVYAE
jgi:uncharacterized protein